jgi:hypothetical protein
MNCGSGRIDSSVGMRGVFRLSVKFKRFLRPLIGIVVAYAVAAQSLLIALGASPFPQMSAMTRRLSSFVCTMPRTRRSCRPAIPIIPATPIASSALPDRIMRQP